MTENGLMSTQENTIRIPTTSQKKIKLCRHELLQLQEENGAVAFTNLCVKVCLAVRVVPVVVNSNMSHPLEEERRTQEKIPILRQPESSFLNFEPFKVTQEETGLIFSCKTSWYCQMTAQSTSPTWEASQP